MDSPIGWNKIIRIEYLSSYKNDDMFHILDKINSVLL